MKTPARPTARLAATCAVVLAVATALGMIGLLLALGTFLRSQPPNPLDGIPISIRLPSQGAVLDQDRVQRVLVQLSPQADIRRLELWVDGHMEGLLQPGQDSYGVAQFTWRPSSAGPHVLVARGYEEGGRTGRSRPVVVEVAAVEATEQALLTAVLAPGETLQTIAEAAGVSAEAIEQANPGLPASPPNGTTVNVPFPADRLPAGFRGDDPIPPEESLPGAAPHPAPGLPRPIELSALASSGCGVDLQWSGGDGAEAFRILRFGAGDADFRQVFETAAEVRSAESTVPDAGRYLFVLTGQNDAGSTESNLTEVDILPEECEVNELPPDDPAAQAWQFDGLELLTDQAFERMYCYLGLGGRAYTRVPRGDDDFLTSPDGQVWDFMQNAGGVNRLVFHWRPDRPQSVRMECWGWQGEVLSSLGEIEFQPDHQRGPRDFVAEEFRMRAAFQPLDGSPLLVPLSHEDPVVPPPYEVGLPTGPVDCASHVVWGSGRELEGGERRFMAWFCAESTVDTLQWEWDENIDTEREDLTGFRVYLNRDYADTPREEDHYLERWEMLGEIGSALQVYPIPRPTCGQTFGYKLQAFIVEREFVSRSRFGEPPDVELVTTERVSTPSETFLLAAGPCPAPSVLVEVVLDTLRVSDTHDECFDIDFECDDVDLEGYGEGSWFRVDGEGQAHEAGSMQFWNERSSCGLGCPVSGPEGRVRAHDSMVLAMEDIIVCTPEGGCTRFGRDHNRIQVWVDGGDAVAFEFTLWDYDGVSGDDVWCGTTDDPEFLVAGLDGPGLHSRSFRIGPFDWETWASFDHRGGDWDNDDFPGQRDHAECSIDVVVTALEVEGRP